MKKVFSLLCLVGLLLSVAITTPALAAPDTTKPTKATNLVATVIADNQVALNWTAATDDVGVVSYDVFRDGSWVGWSTTTNWTDRSPFLGATHQYRINALDAARNWSDRSAPVTISVNGNGPDRTKPRPIVRLDVGAVTSTSVELSWPPATDNVGVKSYDVFRDGRWAGWTTATTWTDDRPNAGTTHSYYINVIDGAGNWSGKGAVDVRVAVPSRDVEPGSNKLLAVGDIARCDRSADDRVGALIAGLEGTVAVLGDVAYPDGTAWEFANCYDPNFGSFKDRTLATPGNHEYNTEGALPYFDYFGVEAAGPRGKGYYSRDIGSWHIVSLNSECWKVGGCGADDPMGQWLQADLAASGAECTLAFWHRPFRSSESGNDNPYLEDLMGVLVDNNVEVLLAGHAHSYERYSRMNASARWSENGIRQFVIGTGGADLRAPGPAEPLQARGQHTEHGVVEFTLDDGSYSWRWIGLPGGNFSDQGTTSCR